MLFAKFKTFIKLALILTVFFTFLSCFTTSGGTAGFDYGNKFLGFLNFSLIYKSMLFCKRNTFFHMRRVVAVFAGFSRIFCSAGKFYFRFNKFGVIASLVNFL